MQQPSQKKPKKEIVISLIKESGDLHNDGVRDENGKRKKSKNPSSEEIKKIGTYYGKDEEDRNFYRHPNGKWYSISDDRVERIK